MPGQPAGAHRCGPFLPTGSRLLLLQWASPHFPRPQKSMSPLLSLLASSCLCMTLPCKSSRKWRHPENPFSCPRTRPSPDPWQHIPPSLEDTYPWTSLQGVPQSAVGLSLSPAPEQPSFSHPPQDHITSVPRSVSGSLSTSRAPEPRTLPGFSSLTSPPPPLLAPHLSLNLELQP